MPILTSVRLLQAATVFTLLLGFQFHALSAPRIGVTIKQQDPPRLGDFAIYEGRFFQGDDEGDVHRTVMTSEVDRVEKDPKSGTTRFRYRWYSRPSGQGEVDHLIDLIENFISGYNSLSWHHIDPVRKAWIAEYQTPMFDEKTGNPTGKFTWAERITYPAKITGPGQVLKDGAYEVKVVSINRKVKTPAGTFRCVVAEQTGPQAGAPKGPKSVIINYNHHRIGLVKSEFYKLEDGKRIRVGTTVLKSAELHDKDGIKSHREYALPVKKDSRENREDPKTPESKAKSG